MLRFTSWMPEKNYSSINQNNEENEVFEGRNRDAESKRFYFKIFQFGILWSSIMEHPMSHRDSQRL